MEPILSDLPFKSGDEVLMFVNGLGGTPLIELYIVYRKAAEIAREGGLENHAQVCRLLHHQPRNGGNVDHAAEAGRRADQTLGCAGAYAAP